MEWIQIIKDLAETVVLVYAAWKLIRKLAELDQLDIGEAGVIILPLCGCTGARQRRFRAKVEEYPSAKLKRLYGPVNDSSGDISPGDFLFLQKK